VALLNASKENLMSAPFIHLHRVRLAQTDAAGVVFFTEPLAIAHVAWEALLDALDQPVSRILSERRFALPIVEASTRILRPIRVGDDVEVAVTLEKLGRSSVVALFTLSVAGTVVSQCRTVHVAVDSAGRTTPLPDDLAAGLGRLPLTPSV
jgi:1,4-dihydroxy-2-naphthoyl-CoA hydrolase